MTKYPPPTGAVDTPFTELYSNDEIKIYGAYSSILFKPLVRITRNMTIIASGPDDAKELTLLNAMRVDEKAEEELKKLGTVKRCIRIGSFHGRDDKYYKEKFEAELVNVGTSSTYTEDLGATVITEDTDEVPGIPGAKLLVFKGVAEGMSEGVIHVPSEGGILLTCDAIQNYAPYKEAKHFSFLGKKICPMVGFKDTCLGPPWVDGATPKGGSLEEEFQRILADLKYEKLFAAHGVLLDGGADAKVLAAVDKVYEKKK